MIVPYVPFVFHLVFLLAAVVSSGTFDPFLYNHKLYFIWVGVIGPITFPSGYCLQFYGLCPFSFWAPGVLLIVFVS